MEELRKRLIVSGLLLACVISFGTLGYMLLEKWPVLDALYMTIITLTTVGFREIHELSSIGKIFTIILIVGGVGTVLYALSTGAKLVLEGELQEIYGRKRLEKKMQALRDHYIICGYGRMGRIICREMKADGLDFIIIEKDASNSQGKDDMLILEGDATHDSILKLAGIGQAKGLISVLPTDAENLFVVLSARELNPGLTIVARAGEEGSEKKLLRAGANRVVSPYHIGGMRIAHTIMKPAVVDFIEFATKSGNIDLQMEEITVQENSRLAGLTLHECGIGRELGVIIVAIKQEVGDMKFNPTFRSVINPGDTLIALGEISRLKVLEEMAVAKS